VEVDWLEAGLSDVMCVVVRPIETGRVVEQEFRLIDWSGEVTVTGVERVLKWLRLWCVGSRSVVTARNKGG
jgi:hypothetical protein